MPLLLLASLLLQAPVARDTTPVERALRAELEAKAHPAMRWPDVSEVLRAAYDARQWLPLWSSEGKATAVARAVLADMSRARARGLDPDDFEAQRLMAAATALQDSPDR